MTFRTNVETVARSKGRWRLQYSSSVRQLGGLRFLQDYLAGASVEVLLGSFEFCFISVLLPPNNIRPECDFSGRGEWGWGGREARS